MAVDIIDGATIRDGLSQRIYEIIPSIPVSQEPQKENVTTEILYIFQRGMDQREEAGGIIRRNYKMMIRFEPLVNSARQLERCAEVVDLLMFGLVLINIGNTKVRGADMSYEIVDDFAQLYVSYPIRTLEINNNPKMETLEINREVY